MKTASSILTVGPVRFVLHGTNSQPQRYEDWAYRGFFTGVQLQDDSCPAVVEFPVHIVHGSLPCPDGPPLFRAGSNWAVWPDDEGLLFCTGDANRETSSRACRMPHALDHAVLHVAGDPVDRPLRYPLDQVLMWGLLGRCNGLLLHAAAVVRDGVGYVLAGRSGAGKSTLSGFCHDQGWEILNDDRVIVHPDAQGNWQVSGTPWHGSGCYACNRTVPLRGIYVLAQDTRDAAMAISRRDARFALMDVASIAWFSPSWSQAALDTLARVCAGVPVCRLHFTRSASAVECLGLEVAA